MNNGIREHDQKYIVLVIYDIISNKQRVKMAKLLLSYGARVQKSAAIFTRHVRRREMIYPLPSLLRSPYI